jgi:glycerol-3-phosphate acyltransferase PlsY
VSLGSLCLLTGFLIEIIVFNRLGILGFQNDYQIKGGLEIELYVLVFIFTALAFYKHRENIKRLLSGTERKIGEKKDKLNQTA